MCTREHKELALLMILCGPLYYTQMTLLGILSRARVKQKKHTIGILSEILEDNQGIGGASLYQVAILYQCGKIRF